MKKLSNWMLFLPQKQLSRNKKNQDQPNNVYI